MRRPVIAGNWKMYKTVSEAIESMRSIRVQSGDVEVVVCAPFTVLSALRALGIPSIALGAQNLYPKSEGAYTGEVSPTMLRDLGVEYVIVGHSERREYFRETDELVNEKARCALSFGITPIICVGESLQVRQEGKMEALVVSQVQKAFKEIPKKDALCVVIAYEPIWAIGTGLTSSAEDANTVNGWIRRTLEELYDADTARGIRIQYGGSVKPSNIKELMNKEHIDGALVGGASLCPVSFSSIINWEEN